MVEKIVFDFLKELTVNNNRDWFHANKSFYDAARQSFDQTTRKLIILINEIDHEVGLHEPKDCNFRIFRDTRFSNDKTPYKINMGSYITKGGKKSPFAGYYLHVEPGSCFLAGGIYNPQPNVLNAVRQDIFHYTDEFLAILQHPDFKKAFGTIDGEQLKTAPKGFDKTWEHINLLKFKSYNMMHAISDELLQSPKAQHHLKETFGLMVPFNHFLNRTIADLV
jgi:uncharacterized protein (TIGR02453 family)